MPTSKSFSSYPITNLPSQKPLIYQGSDPSWCMCVSIIYENNVKVQTKHLHHQFFIFNLTDGYRHAKHVGNTICIRIHIQLCILFLTDNE